MTLRADLPLRSHVPFLSFLREELAPRPGRAAAAVRVATSCAIVTGIGMLYQIPLTAMMVYVVFLISQEDAAGTLVTGLVAGLAATLAVALSLVLYALDASEPALRLPLMAMSTFLGMFLARTLVVGPAAFLAAYVLVLSQTIVDEVPSVEYLTRMVLWLWVIVMVPASVTVTINLAFGQDPRALTRRTASRLLRSLADALRTDASSELRDQSIRALELTAMREHAGIFDRDLQRLSAVDSGLIDTLAEVLAIARILPPQASRPAKASLRALTEHCLAAFERREGGGRPALDLSEETCSASRPVVVAIFAALQRLADGIAQRNAPGASRPTSEHPHPVFAPDAFTSPSHLRFALKATVGAMLAYAIYSGLDWPGINTSMTTVFFVALGSLGESVHKFTLRIGGALVGGTLAALCLVYVLPWMTDVGQLCLLIAAVCAICAWIATSDEWLSYAGLQIAFAFLLGTLQGYGQSTSFTFFKDRMCGILLGNVVVFIVFSLLWPVSVVGRARTSMAASLHAVGGLLKRDAPRPGTRIAILKGVSEGRRLLALAAFELRTLPAEAAARLLLRGESLDRLAAAAFVVVEQDIGGTPDAFRAEDRLTAGWFDAASDRLLSRDGGPVHDLTPPEARAYAGSNTREQIAGEARTLLRHEIEVASAN